MARFIETTREEINDRSKFLVEDLVGKDTGSIIGKKVILSPTSQLLAIVDQNYTPMWHNDILNSVSGVLEGAGVKPTSENIQITEDYATMEVDWKMGRTSDVLPGDKVDFGLTLVNEIGGHVGFDIMGWRQVCSNGLISFSPLYKFRNKESTFVSPDYIVRSIQMCIQQWEDNVLNGYRDMTSRMITKENSLLMASRMILPKKEKETSVKMIEDKYNEFGSEAVSEWEIFNILMFISTHLLARHRHRSFYSQVRAEINPRHVCYHGVPHRFVNS